MNWFVSINFSKRNEGAFNYNFTNCLLKVKTSEINTTTSHFNNCKINKNPDFVNVDNHNFNLNENSSAKDIGELSKVNEDLTNLEYDLNGNSRTIDGKPDAGAVEFIP